MAKKSKRTNRRLVFPVFDDTASDASEAAGLTRGPKRGGLDSKTFSFPRKALLRLFQCKPADVLGWHVRWLFITWEN
jgi:hypothetical protein